MEPQKALEIVAAACAEVNGNLKTHQALQTALQALDTFIEANTPKPEEDD